MFKAYLDALHISMNVRANIDLRRSNYKGEFDKELEKADRETKMYFGYAIKEILDEQKRERERW